MAIDTIPTQMAVGEPGAMARDQRGDRSSVLFSPATWLIAAVAIVNAAWLVVFVANLSFGDRLYVFPRGLHDILGPRLTIRGIDLSTPVLVLYNLALALLPLTLLLFPEVRRWCAEIGRDARMWSRDRRRVAWAIGIAIVLTAVFIVLADHSRLPFVQERVRWATDWFPLPTPIDPPLLVRTEYFVTRIVDARYSFMLADLAFHAGFFVYLVRYFGGRRALVPVALGYVVALSSYRELYYFNGAEAEIPAAVFGLVGLLEVAKGRWGSSSVSFVVGMLFKVTAAFYALPALALIGWRVIRRQLRPRELPWGLAAMSLFITGAFYVGLVLYAFVLRGGLYLVQGAGDTGGTFFIHSVSMFVGEFVTAYPVQTGIAVAGAIWPARDAALLRYAAIGTLLARCIPSASGGYYTMFFVPLWALLAASLFVRLAASRPSWSRTIPPIAATLAVSSAIVVGIADAPQRADFPTRVNLGWDGVVATLDRATPHGATVLFRAISPRYDLERRGRHDLNFRDVGESNEATLAQLAQPGPTLYIAPLSDLGNPSLPGYHLVTRFGGAMGDRYIAYLKER